MDQDLTVRCPKCQALIPLDEVLTGQITETVKLQAEKDYRQKLDEEKRRLWIVAQEKAAEKLKQQTAEEKKALEAELDEKEKRIIESEKKISEFRQQELKLRQKARQLEEATKELELGVQRRLDEEREKIREHALKTTLEENRLLQAEKDKKIADMAKMIEDLKMKAQLGSQQLQGEVLELELEGVLRQEFPIDSINPVAKGIRGADVIQKVRDNLGRECGTIIWETKRTKNWDEGWINKLKEDMRAMKANVAILVSTALPDGVKTFKLREGVYISNFECFQDLAGIVRRSLIEVCHTKSLAVGKNEKIEALYQYITSTEFAQKIEAMMETYSAMKITLEKEKNAMMKIWAQREKEIDGLKNNTIMIHGSLAGLVSDPLAEVDALELANIAFVESGDLIVTSSPETLVAAAFPNSSTEELNESV